MDPVEQFINMCRDKTLPFGAILDFTLDHPTVFCGGEWERVLKVVNSTYVNLSKPLVMGSISVLVFNFAVKQSTSKKFKKQLWRKFRQEIKRTKPICRPQKNIQKWRTMEMVLV